MESDVLDMIVKESFVFKDEASFYSLGSRQRWKCPILCTDIEPEKKGNFFALNFFFFTLVGMIESKKGTYRNLHSSFSNRSGRHWCVTHTTRHEFCKVFWQLTRMEINIFLKEMFCNPVEFSQQSKPSSLGKSRQVWSRLDTCFYLFIFSFRTKMILKNVRSVQKVTGAEWL